MAQLDSNTPSNICYAFIGFEILIFARSSSWSIILKLNKIFGKHFTVFNAFTETESKFNKFLRSFELEQCICRCTCLLHTLLSLLEFAFVWLFACLFVFLFVSMVVMLSMILCNLSLILCICTSLCSYGLVFYTENLL